MPVPETFYTRNGEVDIAYQVIGDGPIDLVFIEGFMTHLDVYWELPSYRRFCERLARFTRLVRFDKRGMGLSDRTRIGTLEERMDDARAVLDALGSDRAVFLGESEGGPMSLLFAATYPERTRALILCGAEVRERKDADWPWGESTPEDFESYMQTFPQEWGRSVAFSWLDAAVPSLADDQGRSWAARLMRHAMSPGAAADFCRMAFDIDVRHVLSAINVPTLVLHHAGDRICHVENARYLASHIPAAKYVELPGEDHVPWFGGDDMLTEIEEFVTGVREPAEPERALATVLFTDVVGSTALAAQLGDRRWRDLVQRHHETVRKQLDRFRGHEIDVAGDGFLASFDGPGRAIRCARSILSAVAELGLQVRAGLHTGECELIDGKLAGIAVHTGARIAATAGPNEILASSTVRDLVAGSGIEFQDRAVHLLKGVPGEWHLYAVAAA
jgi:pimeloyl-ACP methyl ester carboxylesterase